jgi:hypothetical protein
MTKEEILGIATGQAAALQNANTLLQRFNQPAQEPRANAFDLDRELPDGEYAENSKVKDIIRRLGAQTPQSDPVARQIAAQNALGLVQLQRPDEFKRWGQEIRQMANGMAQDNWTVDNLSIIVDIVKSRHVDELAAEKAQQLVNESHPTIRSGTGGSGSVSQTQLTLASDRLPKSWVEKAKMLGIDEAVVREFCQVTGQTEEQYLADIERYGKNGSVIRG